MGFIAVELGAQAFQAAHIVAIRIEALSFLPAMALAAAASTLTRQYLGAGDGAGASARAIACWLGGAGAMTLLGVAFVAVPGVFVRLVTDEPELLQLSPKLVRICGLAHRLRQRDHPERRDARRRRHANADAARQRPDLGCPPAALRLLRLVPGLRPRRRLARPLRRLALPAPSSSPSSSRGDRSGWRFEGAFVTRGGSGGTDTLRSSTEAQRQEDRAEQRRGPAGAARTVGPHEGFLSRSSSKPHRRAAGVAASCER